MRKSLFLLIAAIVSLPLFAQPANNELGLHIGSADMGDFGDAGTLSLTYNRFWTAGLSTKFGLTAYGADLEVVDLPPGGASAAGELEMGALTAQLEYHFLRGSRFSPYAGAGVAFVTAELADTPAGDFEADSEVTAIVNGGVDLNLGRRWAINGDISYMPYTADFVPVESIEMDPLTISAGVKFRW